MDDLTIIGRAMGNSEFQDANSCERGYQRGRPKVWYSLVEAAALAERSVYELRQAIDSGELRAERRGRWRIHTGDLKTYLYR